MNINTKWIKVKLEKKLPLYKECIFFYSKKSGVNSGHYKGKNEDNKNWFVDNCGFSYFDDEVTHWLPMSSIILNPPE